VTPKDAKLNFISQNKLPLSGYPEINIQSNKSSQRGMLSTQPMICRTRNVRNWKIGSGDAEFICLKENAPKWGKRLPLHVALRRSMTRIFTAQAVATVLRLPARAGAASSFTSDTLATSWS